MQKPQGRRTGERVSIGYSSRRRPRGRRGWWWGLTVVLAALVGLAVLVNDRGMDARREVAFVDEIRIVLQGVEEVSAGFRRLVGDELRFISRDDFDVLMNRLSEELGAELDRFRQIEAPESVTAIHELMWVALGSWEVGLADFRAAVTAAADDPTGSVPVDRLGGSIAQIRVGDLVYARFFSRATELAEDLAVVGDIPSVSFITNQRPLLNGERLARTIRSSTAMGVRRDVAILQVVFDPLPAGGLGSEGEILFPSTERLQFSVVAGNRGNVDQKGLAIRATVRKEDGEAGPSIESPGIDLAAGEIGSRAFDPIAVEPGAEYLLTLKLTVVEDELDAEDNIWESRIRINPPG